MQGDKPDRVDTTGSNDAPATDQRRRRYDLNALTYSNSFDNPMKRALIRGIEWMTGKITIIRMIRQFEQVNPIEPSAFWAEALKVMGIRIGTPDAQVAHIPSTGPVVFVANHPHGMVDGMVLGALINRVRDDYKILTRSLLTDIDPIASRYLIPVPFPHQSDAQEKMVEMRTRAMEELNAGGLIVVFPSGGVATSRTAFGPVIESDWNVFTAKIIRTTGATVVPCYFPGENSRAYQIANQVSATLRQSLLLREIVRSRNTRISPVIGPPLDPAFVTEQLKEPRRFMAWLRDHTLALKDG